MLETNIFTLIPRSNTSLNKCIVTGQYDGINGFLISPCDVDKWAEKIGFVLSIPNESIAMGLNGRRKVEQYFNLENITDMMEMLYIEAVSQ